MATGRVDLGGSKPKSAPARSSGGMGKNDKMKLGIAIGALVVGGLVMGWYFGAFDSLFAPKIPDGAPVVGGTQVTPEKKAEYDEVKKQYDEMLDKAKEGGATSAGS